MSMTKQQARRLIVGLAKHLKKMGFDSSFFKEKLKNRNFDDHYLEAYDLIQDEMTHVYAVVWGWDR